MIELDQPKWLPLQTGDYIPKGRFALGLNSLIPLTEEGKVKLIPRTLTEIQERLGSETCAVLSDVLIENFGLTNLTFIELYHPDSIPLVFAGQKNGEGFVNRSLDKSVAIISLGRSTAMGWSGDAGVRFNNRLLPVSIGVSGVDQQTKRIVSVSYGAEYDFSEADSSNSSEKVIFVLDEVGISVSREDGFEFKEERGTLDILPYTYVSQYCNGIFTKEMLAKTDVNGRQVFSNRINVNRFRLGEPRLECPLRLETPILAGLVNYPEDFEVVNSDSLVSIGRRNIWEVQVPKILPTPGKIPTFLKTSK